MAPTGFKILSVNYYDDYNFPNGPTVFGTAYYNNSLKPKGLATGSRVRVCQGVTETKGETSYTLYDYKARAIQTKTVHYLGGYTQTDSNLDFVGKPISSETRHKRTVTDAEIRVNEVFTYSAQDRLLTHTHQINGGAVQLLANNSYDELGKLTSKKVGGAATGTGLQNVNYSYNIRGWLTGINDINSLSKAGDPMDLFSFKINYQKPVSATPLFNGNISETFWRTSSDNVLRKYSYSYDHLNRLLEAVYQKPGGPMAVTHSYDESLQYDKNGNILSLRRNGSYDSDVYLGGLMIDDLQYQYESNKLLKVVDYTNNPDGFSDNEADAEDPTNLSNVDYRYDLNGNMTMDMNKNITSITYNHLNLPTKIVFNNYDLTKIEYLYDANGTKLQKKVTNGSATTTDYMNGIQYKNSILQFIPTKEGYVNNTFSGGINNFSYVFNYTDHLGNIRLSYAKDPNTGLLKIMEQNHYYPFGMKHSNYNSDVLVFSKIASSDKPITIMTPFNKAAYNYKFQGQERQDELGLNWDSFKWRNYDYAIGRFMSVDPLAEKYSYNGVYNFSENRVVDGRELEGLEVDLSKDVIMRTVQIQSQKPQNTRPGVSLIEFGIGGELSKSKSVESGGVSSDGTLTIVKGSIAYSVCIDGDRAEFGVTIGQSTGDVKVVNNKISDASFTTLDANGSYNTKTGSFDSNVNYITFGDLKSVNGERNKDTGNDIKASINEMGVYINANFTEMGNSLMDATNVIMSHLEATIEDFFARGGSEKCNPVIKNN